MRTRTTRQTTSVSPKKSEKSGNAKSVCVCLCAITFPKCCSPFRFLTRLPCSSVCHALALRSSGCIAAGVGQKGAEAARPYLQRLYRTRMSSYRDAIKEFSAGFGEGLSQPTQEEEPQQRGAAMAAKEAKGAKEGGGSRAEGASKARP